MTACHILDHEGVTDGYGHISVRVPGADAFITIANVSPGCVTRDRLIMQDLDGNYLDGAKTPPNEWPIHACILKARPEIVSVAHTHSKWSTIFSVLPIKLKPMHHYGKFLSADGPPVYQGVGLVRTVERGNELAAALGKGPVVLCALTATPWSARASSRSSSARPGSRCSASGIIWRCCTANRNI